MQKKYRIGIDVGGTFTDLVMVDPETGVVTTTKTPSTPKSPDQAIIDGLGQLGVELGEVEYLAHGTTVGTNALITGELPRTALICNEGFRDVLEIGRGPRPDLWDAYADPAPPLAKRRDRFAVGGRIDFSGAELEPLDRDAVRKVGETLVRRGITTVAVCLLHAYIEGKHEREVREILAEVAPDVAVSLSHEVLPEIFEFERSSTTVINAALSPVVNEYLNLLQTRLEGAGFVGELLILHSGGGVMQVPSVVETPARIAKSGPAAGGAAMAHIAEQCGFDKAIGLDVGGTSSDISLCSDGELHRANETAVNYGQPILFPSIDVETIGAGGGSVAWIDAGGSLRNGPMSQRADPGPACYQRGGTEPTNTDAHLVLGRITEDGFLAGMTVSKQASEDALREKVADPMGVSVVDAAAATIKVATANMAGATRLITTKRGLDPRDFALVGFGGGGPLHAAELAEELEMSQVILPKWPGLTSAYGCLVVDTRHDLAKTYIARSETVDFSALDDEFVALEAEAVKRLSSEGFAPEAMRIERQIDMRYLGQWRSLSVDATGAAELGTMLERFHAEHQQTYAYSEPERSVEIYGLRVTGLGLVEELDLSTGTAAGAGGAIGGRTRQVYFTGVDAFVETTILSAHQLAEAGGVQGPAIVEQSDTTLVVPPHWTAEVHSSGNVILTDTRKTPIRPSLNAAKEQVHA